MRRNLWQKLTAALACRHLPNLITGLRFVLVVPTLTALLHERYPSALAFFLVAALSDGLDGLLARGFNWTSRLGAMLDPVADKLLLMGSFAALSYLGHLPLWLTLTVVGRDLWILAGALAWRTLTGALDCRPFFLSKLNTCLQLALILLTLGFLAFRSASPSWLEYLSLLTFGTTLASGLQYTWTWGRRAAHYVRTRSKHALPNPYARPADPADLSARREPL